jgi:hypothetical protein
MNFGVFHHPDMAAKLVQSPPELCQSSGQADPQPSFIRRAPLAALHHKCAYAVTLTLGSVAGRTPCMVPGDLAN